MNLLNRLLRRPDPREGRVCKHAQHAHFDLPAVGGPTYHVKYDYCVVCGASWYPEEPELGPYVRRRWRWVPA